MAEITKRNLVLTFGTPAGGEEKITINSPKENLTAEAIDAAMDAIIDSKAFGETQVVSTKVEAKYVIQEAEAIKIQN